MAPARAKKPKVSPTLATTTMHAASFTTTKSPARTPIASPSKRAARKGITISQKQALIDNLQLELTERARKLRAQYALQAQSLRTRIEMRVNRIPTSLRNTNMGELLEKYMQLEAATFVALEKSIGPAPTVTLQQESNDPRPRPTMPNTTAAPPSPLRGTKRTSDVLASFDQENSATVNSISTTKPLPNKKQRADPTTVLSPKSGNSRTVPVSPSHHDDFRSPQKSSHLNLQRQPASLLKSLASSSSKLSRIGSSSSSTTTTKKSNQSQDAALNPPTKAKRATKATAASGGRPNSRAAGATKTQNLTAAATTSKSIQIHDENSSNSGSGSGSGSSNVARTVSAASNSSTGTTIVKKTKKTATTTSTTVAAGTGTGRGKAAAKIVKAAAVGKKGPSAPASASTAAGSEEVKGGGRRVLRKR